MDLEQYYLVARLDYALRRAGRVSRLWYRYLKSLLAFSLSSRTSKIISTVAPRLSAVKIAMELYDASCTKTGCRSSYLRGGTLGAKEYLGQKNARNLPATLLNVSRRCALVDKKSKKICAGGTTPAQMIKVNCSSLLRLNPTRPLIAR